MFIINILVEHSVKHPNSEQGINREFDGWATVPQRKNIHKTNHMKELFECFKSRAPLMTDPAQRLNRRPHQG